MVVWRLVVVIALDKAEGSVARGGRVERHGTIGHRARRGFNDGDAGCGDHEAEPHVQCTGERTATRCGRGTRVRGRDIGVGRVAATRRYGDRCRATRVIVGRCARRCRRADVECA